jgi:hypothetical protein
VSALVTHPRAPGCPSGWTAETCAACAGTKAPADCLACLRTRRAYGPAGLAACVGCAGLADAKLRGACVGCVQEFGPGAKCASCLLPAGGASASSAAAGAIDATKSAQCFQCVADGGAPARASTMCSECFVSRSGAPVDAAPCLACTRDGARPAAARAGCGACHEAGVLDRPGCMSCLASKGAQDPEKSPVCGACSQPNLAAVKGQCYTCLGTLPGSYAFMCARLGQVRLRLVWDVGKEGAEAARSTSGPHGSPGARPRPRLSHPPL